jgi:hypothetical protein
MLLVFAVALIGVVSVFGAHNDAAAGVTSSNKGIDFAAELRGGGFHFGGHIRWYDHAHEDVLGMKMANAQAGASPEVTQTEYHHDKPTLDHGASPSTTSLSNVDESAPTGDEFVARAAATGSADSSPDAICEDVQQAFAELNPAYKRLAENERALIARALLPATHQLDTEDSMSVRAEALKVLHAAAATAAESAAAGPAAEQAANASSRDIAATASKESELVEEKKVDHSSRLALFAIKMRVCTVSTELHYVHLYVLADGAGVCAMRHTAVSCHLSHMYTYAVHSCTAGGTSKRNFPENSATAAATAAAT